MQFWAVLCLLLSGTAVADDLEQNRQVMRRCIQLFEKGEENWARFHYLRRREHREYESDGKLRARRSFTHRNEPYQEIDVLRLIARDDQPLSPSEMARQEERLKAALASHRSRQAGQAQQKTNPRRSVDEEAQLMREFPEALDYRVVGTDKIDGRPATILEFTPRPGYVPRSFKYKVFEKLRGKSWIDQTSGEMVRVEAEVFENVSVGFGVLGKINKGTRFQMTRTEAAPGLWMPTTQRIHFEVRVMLVKNMRQEIDVNFSEYKMKPANKMAASQSVRP